MSELYKMSVKSKFKRGLIGLLVGSMGFLPMSKAFAGKDYPVNEVIQQGSESNWYDNYDFTSRGVTGYWPLDENATDYSGNGHHGIVVGAVPTEGILSQGYYFDGQNDYIDSTYIPQLEEDDSLSISFWAKMPLNPATHNARLMGLEQSGGQEIDFMLYAYSQSHGKGGKVQMGFRNDDQSSGVAPLSSEPLCDGQWHHFVGIRDADNFQIQLYVDGVLNDFVNGSTGTYNIVSPRSLCFGANNHSGNGIEDNFNGVLDEIAIFNYPLSNDEVSALISDSNGDGVADFWIRQSTPDIYLSSGDSINEMLDSVVGTEDNPITLHLAPGVYEEDVTMDEWENITGEDRFSSIIRGSVQATDNSSLTNLAVQNSKLYSPTICIDSTEVSPTINRVVVDGNGNPLSLGILVAGPGSDNAQITDNDVMRHHIGITYNNSNATLTDNTISDSEYGVWYANPVDSKQKQLGKIIKKNKFKNIILHHVVDLEKGTDNKGHHKGILSS